MNDSNDFSDSEERPHLRWSTVVLVMIVGICVWKGATRHQEASDISAMFVGGGDVQRIAVLPTVVDFERGSALSKDIGAFESRLQAELLKSWDVDLLIRAGMTEFVFEQKLHQAKTAHQIGATILPADCVLLSALDYHRRELRIFPVMVGERMKLPAPIIISIGDSSTLATSVPEQAAQMLARQIKLRKAADSGISGTMTKDASARKKVVCAVLDPISSLGNTSSLPQISASIRAVLDRSLAALGERVELVDRSQLSALLQEHVLEGVSAGFSGAQVGRLVNADLVFVPYVHFRSDENVSTDLFVVNPSTGSILAAASWTGGALSEPPNHMIESLVSDALGKSWSRESDGTRDDRERRHQEARFITSLRGGGFQAGLRPDKATSVKQSIRWSDAALSLAHDDESQMMEIAEQLLYYSTASLRHPSHAELHPDYTGMEILKPLLKNAALTKQLNEAAKRVYELPLTGLLKAGHSRACIPLADLWISTGDAQKAVDMLSKEKGVISLDIESHDARTCMCRALMNLGRNKEAADFMLQTKEQSELSSELAADALHLCKDFDREMKLLWDFRSNFMTESSFVGRFLGVLTLKGRAREALDFVTRKASHLAFSKSEVWIPLVRARLATGQKELAISGAQCALLAARYGEYNEEETALRELLAEIGAAPLGKLPKIAQGVRWPADSCIHFVHDDTVNAPLALGVARQMAEFWGCRVKVWVLHSMSLQQLSFYRPVSKVVSSRRLSDMCARVKFPEEVSLGVVLLTLDKFHHGNGEDATDSSGTSTGAFSVRSGYYVDKFHPRRNRPFEEELAVLTSSLWGVQSFLIDDSNVRHPDDGWFSPFPPDVFSKQWSLSVGLLDLGVAPHTLKLLKEIDMQEMILTIQQEHEMARRDAPHDFGPDQRFVKLWSDELASQKPVVVSPR